MNRRRAVVLSIAVVLVSACGVSTEDRPRIIEDTTSQPPEPTPSIDSETGPTPSPSSTTSTSPSLR